MAEKTGIEWCDSSKEAFLSKIRKDPNGCWIWTAAINGNGYGRFREWSAHRFSWLLHKGEVPAGLYLDHLCRNRACVNPDHLEPVTNQENTQRGGRGDLMTHCPKGHPRDNEWSQGNGEGKRTCRACRQERDANRVRPPGYWKAVNERRKGKTNG